MEPRDTGISLVLVTRNRESDLARTLETLKGALCPCPWEIILVDNASDTDMSRVCKASGLENLRFFRTEENLGPPGGRNFGASQARYEYLVFLDDDANFIGEDALVRIYDRMNREPDFAIFAFQVRNLEGGFTTGPTGSIVCLGRTALSGQSTLSPEALPFGPPGSGRLAASPPSCFSGARKRIWC